MTWKHYLQNVGKRWGQFHVQSVRGSPACHLSSDPYPATQQQPGGPVCVLKFVEKVNKLIKTYFMAIIAISDPMTIRELRLSLFIGMGGLYYFWGFKEKWPPTYWMKEKWRPLLQNEQAYLGIRDQRPREALIVYRPAFAFRSPRWLTDHHMGLLTRKYGKNANNLHDLDLDLEVTRVC